MTDTVLMSVENMFSVSRNRREIHSLNRSYIYSLVKVMDMFLSYNKN